MDKTTNKQRTPSRCREWERQRRLKFNDAISKLGELVKSINKTNNALEDPDNVQYPKIEVIQKAIICLTNFVNEKTQLKAEILALEIKLEAIEKNKLDRKDVSLQAALGVNKKNQNSKYLKLLMVQKSKQKNVKEKEVVKDSEKNQKKGNLLNKFPPKLPKLLPLTQAKKENTIVMLPATPYIFPQRPVIFPQPPTIVLVDANLQPINKTTTIPVIGRNGNDITKTTMVNVLPISAYSRPLSEKSKRNSNKARTSAPKKGSKKVNQTIGDQEIKQASDSTIKKCNENSDNKCVDKKNSNPDKEVIPNSKTEDIEINKSSISQNSMQSPDEDSNITKNNIPPSDREPENKTEKDNVTKETHNSDKLLSLPKCSDPSPTKAISKKLPEQQLQNMSKAVAVSTLDNKPEKNPPDKPSQEFKSKDNKIQNILDTTICENVVDGGNARLELAEEFLAASPTAAFLMSFPLVSGNRADSPADDTQANNSKENHQRTETLTQPVSYFEKTNVPQNKTKLNNKSENENSTYDNNPVTKSSEHKYESNKPAEIKVSSSVSNLVPNENPFLNLPLPSVIPTTCNLTDASFTIDFDCTVGKSGTSQVTTYSSTTNNIFYKGDPFNTVKNSIYSTSTISSGHEYNTLGLYPCAMENYSNKNKTDFTNVDDNIMKINTSRLTYDIDLGWSHKGFDFVNCTTSANTFHKDNILTNTSTPFSNAYNPFNPEFHVPLVPSSSKKNSNSKPNTFPEQITTFYNQSTNLWPEDAASIHANTNASKHFNSKQQNYFTTEHLQTNINLKASVVKPFDAKQLSENTGEVPLKQPSAAAHNLVDKYTKKSPSKMHINWMTSEIRPMQNNCSQNQTQLKENIKIPYTQNEQVNKKHVQNNGNYFPINMHHFPQPNHEELTTWPTTRPAGTTEISMEPPPINLPTLVGDLALGPHDKKKNEALNRTLPHTDLQNCANFLSVTQLMNRSNENMSIRPHGLIAEAQKSSKQNISNSINDGNRKTRLENHPQLCYGFGDTKISHTFENINHFTQPKAKSNKPEKSSKTQKNSYSAEALIRGGTSCSQKLHDNSGTKFMMPQKYNEFNISQDSGVAQVSHFPPILDYSDNSYSGQQFSGTTLYNSTTNTISNSFYSNFMPGSSNLMTSNYSSAPFSTDFVDYNQSAECNNYTTNHKYGDSKLRSNAPTYQEKDLPNYKSSRRETAAKHKLECSKKESSKKYQSKRAKLSNEVDEWNDSSHLFWQNKTQSKKHQNMMSEELTFPNYMGNQMPSQYQPDFFNSHLMQSNIQNVGSNVDRSLSGIPVASRANFNLSALFPEITMKVQ